MGGFGSGRWGTSRRPLAESIRRIDLAKLRHEEPSLTARHVLKVECVRDNGERVEVATVYLEATRMYFGGRRGDNTPFTGLASGIKLERERDDATQCDVPDTRHRQRPDEDP